MREGRDGLRQVVQRINALWARLAPPGLAYISAVEDMAAYTCVGLNASSAAVQAEADGSVFAVGVLVEAVVSGRLAIIRTQGTIAGAVSGRVANDPVWVGDDGSLVFAAPGGASYAQQIATCINATDIFVLPAAPVI